MKKVIVGEARRTFVGTAVKGIDSKSRTIRAYASTNAWDRYGERFAPDAFKAGLDNYKKNPVVLFAHDYSQAPVAKAIGYEFDDIGLILTMKFADSEKANEIFALYEGGFMSAFSVGFTPLELSLEERVKGTGDVGTVFVRAELLEKVWGLKKASHMDVRTVDQHIARLRQKLPARGVLGTNVIKTQNSFGYMYKQV